MQAPKSRPRHSLARSRSLSRETLRSQRIASCAVAIGHGKCRGWLWSLPARGHAQAAQRQAALVVDTRIERHAIR